MSEEQIQFVVNLDKFMSIKKLKIEPKVTKEDIIEFFTSIQFTCTQKINEYLEKIIDSEKLLEQTKNLFSLEINDFIKEINTAKTKKIINSVLPAHLEKKQKDAYIEAVKVYLINKYCLDKKLVLSYNQIIFPSKKKMMKVKK